jgi:hypothetical protein
LLPSLKSTNHQSTQFSHHLLLPFRYVRPENEIIIGDRVEGNYRRRGVWFPGTIDDERGDYLVKEEDGKRVPPVLKRCILYDDDGVREWLDVKYLRHLEAETPKLTGVPVKPSVGDKLSESNLDAADEDGGEKKKRKRKKKRESSSSSKGVGGIDDENNDDLRAGVDELLAGEPADEVNNKKGGNGKEGAKKKNSKKTAGDDDNDDDGGDDDADSDVTLDGRERPKKRGRTMKKDKEAQVEADNDEDGDAISEGQGRPSPKDKVGADNDTSSPMTKRRRKREKGDGSGVEPTSRGKSSSSSSSSSGRSSSSKGVDGGDRGGRRRSTGGDKGGESDPDGGDFGSSSRGSSSRRGSGGGGDGGTVSFADDDSFSALGGGGGGDYSEDDNSCPWCAKNFATHHNMIRHTKTCGRVPDDPNEIALVLDAINASYLRWCAEQRREKERKMAKSSSSGQEGRGGGGGRKSRSVYVTSADLEEIRRKEESRGETASERRRKKSAEDGSTFWACPKCASPNLLDVFDCSKCKLRRPREVKAIKRLGPDEMRSPYERKSTDYNYGDISSQRPDLVICPDCGKGFDNTGNLNRHLPYCPVLKASGIDMSPASRARLAAGRRQGQGNTKAADSDDDGTGQPHVPPRVGDRFQAEIARSGGRSSYPFNFAPNARKDRRKYKGDENLYADDDLDEMLKEAAAEALKAAAEGAAHDEWLLDANAAESGGSALFRKRDETPEPMDVAATHAEKEKEQQQEKETESEGGSNNNPPQEKETESEGGEAAMEGGDAGASTTVAAVDSEKSGSGVGGSGIGAVAAASSSSSSSSSSSTDGAVGAAVAVVPDAEEKAEHLLRLFHSSKCPYEKGHCPASKYCAQSKILWRHSSQCKNASCRHELCKQARAALDHYRNCRAKAVCPCCSYVFCYTTIVLPSFLVCGVSVSVSLLSIYCSLLAFSDTT